MLYIFAIIMRDPAYQPEQYADAWERASRYIQARPGARGTRLHRDIHDPRRLLAIASWESQQARDAMDADPPAEIAAIIATQTPFVEIEYIGEFADPEWVVLPPASEEKN